MAKFLLSSLEQFLLDNLVYLIVGAMIITFIIIVIVAAKKRNKPVTYTPDEIDRTVDMVAKEKAMAMANEISEEPVTQQEPVAQPESVAQPEPVAEVEEGATPIDNGPKQVQSIEEALLTDDAEEELTFEAADVDEAKDEPKNATPTKRRTISYRILYDRETRTWEVRKDNAKRVIRRVRTKREALEIAQELSQKQDLNLVVHKKDGKFQKRR